MRFDCLAQNQLPSPKEVVQFYFTLPTLPTLRSTLPRRG
ncbi:hypothetical protein RISK_001623 [Rhodopirellula islandica]|uniref:Uncharacterized protein n=1 Tax=Rhodopirellula islandica TaxID=595434 RepID=A0A0J1BIQ2_RHOIS|nr:hypothetical protein RISK_001623 [Rhodopirellula islandica]